MVDDDREVRSFLEQMLTKAGFAVTLAGHGVRLVSTLQTNQPDLILLDVVNSWIDGIELCRALKQNPRFCAIPIVFVSGHSAPADIERGLAVGAADYFPKPIDSRRLLTRLTELVALP